MEAFRKVVVVVLVMAAVLGNEVKVSNALTLCKLTGADLSTCKPFVTQGNNAQPSGQCCAALSHADFKCLCSYRNSMWLRALGIDVNLALQLPAKCRFSRPIHC